MPPRQFPTSLDPSSASSARPGPSSSALTYPAVSDPAAPSVPIRSPPFRPLPYSRCSLPAPAPAQLPSAKTCCLPPAGSSSCSPHLSNLNERTCARAPANFAARSTSLSAELPSRSEAETTDEIFLRRSPPPQFLRDDFDAASSSAFTPARHAALNPPSWPSGIDLLIISIDV